MPASTNQIKVAISSDFLKALDALPKSQRHKVHEFIDAFRENPMSSAINYEKIQGARDANLRSARIDQAYRAIILKPEKGNVYVLLWVANHDDAYQWARNRVVNIHPDTGSLQVVPVAEDAPLPEEQSIPEVRAGLFSSFRDRELVRLGVPSELMPLVRQMQSEQDLDMSSGQLPSEAYEALFMLAADYTLEEVARHMELAKVPTVVDTEDFVAALERAESKRRFYVVDDEHELKEILEAPLEQWRVFLHPTQRQLVEMNANGPVRVLGGAGTGKTVVAMHRARRLAENLKEGERVLFTTFTTNLAADIRENLSKICSPEVMRRIEVVNIDRWVSEFLQRHGYDYEIDFGKRSEDLWKTAMNLAPSELGLSESFYREEWERVIQPNGVTTLAEYLRVSRVGRGVSLSRASRQQVWPVFEDYRASLTENGLKESDDAMRDARAILEQKGDILPYKSIIVDEAQDMGTQAFRLLRQIIPGGDRPNDLFIVGDAHQRIYRHKVVLGKCGINIKGRSRKLRINYRTTEETRRWSVQLLEGLEFDDLDEGVDTLSDGRSLLHGEAPQLHSFGTFSEEVGFLVDLIRQEGESSSSTCLVARTNDLVTAYDNALSAAGITTYRLRRSVPEDHRRAGVRLATMHRVKGLEFDHVIIAGAGDGTIPLENPNADEGEIERIDHELRERALLYVAATRARKRVNITNSGRISRFFRK